jgi:hypothetical protein
MTRSELLTKIHVIGVIAWLGFITALVVPHWLAVRGRRPGDVRVHHASRARGVRDARDRAERARPVEDLLREAVRDAGRG